MARVIEPKDTTREQAYNLWMKAPNPMETFFKTLDVTNIVKKSIANIQLYEIRTGKIRETRMWSSQYHKYPVQVGNIISISSLEKKNKKEPTGEVDEVTGKRIYRDVPDKFEYWLSKFTILEEDELW